MKSILILWACCLLMGCSTSMQHERFFCTLSARDIPDVSEESITYRTDYIDYHFVEAGTISNPLFGFDIKYDTLSHYRVVVLGRLVFGETKHDGQYERIDSVEINRLIISSLNAPRELYCKNGDEYCSKISWKECSLPKKNLKKIRKDFLIRMKYKRYVINKSDSIKGITTLYEYHLY